MPDDLGDLEEEVRERLMARRPSVREPDWVTREGVVRFDSNGFLVDAMTENPEPLRTSDIKVCVRAIASHMCRHRRRDGHIHVGRVPCGPLGWGTTLQWATGGHVEPRVPMPDPHHVT